MIRANILAHRGLWRHHAEKNSLAALRAALAAGFGVETDFRDAAGSLVVSHDPPRAEPAAMVAETFFALRSKLGADGRLALNIKADGLQDMLSTALAAGGVPREDVFAFDMSVPDALGYLAKGFPAYTRVSQYETTPPFIDRARGVWVDDFVGDFPQAETCRMLLDRGLRVALVSPELHRRDPKPVWHEVAQLRLHDHPRFELCTDLPEEAFDRFGTK